MTVFGIGPLLVVTGICGVLAVSALALIWHLSVALSPSLAVFRWLAGSGLALIGLSMWRASVHRVVPGYRQGRLVTGGAYSSCRNPMYAAFIVFLVPGTAFLCNNMLVLLVSAFLYVIFLMLIGKEERYLQQKFKDEYRRYCSTVPRLFPKVIPDGRMRGFRDDSLRQAATLVFAAAQLCVPFFSQLTGIGEDIGARSARDAAVSPEVPAAYAFGIWFVIFILSAVYAVYQALPLQRKNRLFREIGFNLCAAFLLSTAWMMVVQVCGDGWLPAVIIVLMLAAVLQAFLVFVSGREKGAFSRFVMAPLLGLYSGWLSVAVFLNAAAVLKQPLLRVTGFSVETIAVFVIISASLFSLRFIIKSRGNGWFSGTTLWALVGVFIANAGGLNRVLTGVCVGMSVAVITALFYIRRRHGK